MFPLRLKLSLDRKASARSVLPPVTAGVLLEASTEVQAVDSTGVRLSRYSAFAVFDAEIVLSLLM